MDDLELVKKIPEAAEAIGETAKEIETTSGLIAASLQRLKKVSEANLAASKVLREAMDELRARARRAQEGKGGENK